jgi:hypothetical protein
LIQLPSNQTWDFGTIARTENMSTGQHSGSIVIMEANPRFTITGEDDLHEGMPVDKVGRTTGWTHGNVLDTCAYITHSDPDVGSFKYLCQGLADYFSGGGDSGSPVFSRNRTEVNLVGIHWGAFTSGQEERIFSPLANIREDLGNITIN